MVVALATMLALTGCTPASQVVEGTTVTVVVDQPFTSYNANTAFGGGSSANASIFAATHSSFFSYDETPALVAAESLGTVEVVSTQPLVVTYTVRDGDRWSDGTPIDAADLLLAWAANSRSLNDDGFDASQYVDQGTGRFTDQFPTDVVYFDGFTGNGLQLVTQTPVIGDGGRSITMTFDEYFADWKLVFDLGLPAHVVAGESLKIPEPQKAKDALIAAVEKNDRRALARISRFWNSGFVVGEEGVDPQLFVGNGPYRVSAVTPGDQVTLTVNPHYRGKNLPQFEKVIVTVISDPLQAVAALESGEADIIAPQATSDVMTALEEVTDAQVEHGYSGTWERLDVQFSASKNGFVENELVRRAFLMTVPREQMVRELIRPVNPNAATRDSHVFLPGTAGYDDAVKANGSGAYSRVDIAGARRLLAEAAAVSPASANPTVCVLFDPANPRRVAEFELIAGSAAEAGITVTNCSSPDWRNLLGTPGSYDAALYALRETNLSMAGLEASYHSRSELNNYSHYASPEADALLTEAAGAVKPADRREALTNLDTLLFTDAVGLPLYQFPTVTATRSGVTDVIRSPFEATALWNPWQWEPTEERGAGGRTAR